MALLDKGSIAGKAGASGQLRLPASDPPAMPVEMLRRENVGLGGDAGQEPLDQVAAGSRQGERLRLPRHPHGARHGPGLAGQPGMHHRHAGPADVVQVLG